MESKKEEFDKEHKNEEIKNAYLKEPLSDRLQQEKKSQKFALILEDEEKIVKLYLRFFTSYSYNFKIVTSLKDAFNLIQDLKEKGVEPTVLITDFHLPDGESTEFVKAAKKQFSKMKVILTSSDDSASSIVPHDVSIKKGKIFEIKARLDEYFTNE